MQYVVNFNNDFQKIILCISDISFAKQKDRYSRGLKPYIWKEMYTQEYGSLNGAIPDAKWIEAAHRRIRVPKMTEKKTPRGGSEYAGDTHGHREHPA